MRRGMRALRYSSSIFYECFERFIFKRVRDIQTTTLNTFIRLVHTYTNILYKEKITFFIVLNKAWKTTENYGKRKATAITITDHY